MSELSRLVPLKVVIAGGSGVGKTALLRAASDIVPIASEPDFPVAFEFGRLTLEGDLVLYLFGLPAEHRFSFLRDQLSRGAHGAVVLSDATRLEDCFESIDYFESRQMPFTLAVNSFGRAPQYALGEVRDALSVPPGTAVIDLDVDDRDAVRFVLRDLAERSMGLVR